MDSTTATDEDKQAARKRLQDAVENREDALMGRRDTDCCVGFSLLSARSREKLFLICAGRFY